MKKVVMKVSMHGDKCRTKAMDIFIEVMKAMIPCGLLWNQKKPSAAKNRTKAMQVVAGMPGIVSVALDGEEKNQVVVLGDDFDPVKLVELLRREVGYADVLSVDSSYTEKEEPKKKETPEEKKEPAADYPQVQVGVPSIHVVELDNPGCNCSIM